MAPYSDLPLLTSLGGQSYFVHFSKGAQLRDSEWGEGEGEEGSAQPCPSISQATAPCRSPYDPVCGAGSEIRQLGPVLMTMAEKESHFWALSGVLNFMLATS